MALPNWVVHELADSRSEPKFTHSFFCPGCRCGHGFNVDPRWQPCWTFNGDLVRPTLQPSYLVRGHLGKDKDGVSSYGVCHSFVTDGRITFLTDSTHALAGQTVALEPF
jgi:hypothetical protein